MGPVDCTISPRSSALTSPETFCTCTIHYKYNCSVAGPPPRTRLPVSSVLGQVTFTSHAHSVRPECCMLYTLASTIRHDHQGFPYPWPSTLPSSQCMTAKIITGPFRQRSHHGIVTWQNLLIPTYTRYLGNLVKVKYALRAGLDACWMPLGFDSLQALNIENPSGSSGHSGAGVPGMTRFAIKYTTLTCRHRHTRLAMGYTTLHYSLGLVLKDQTRISLCRVPYTNT